MQLKDQRITPPNLCRLINHDPVMIESDCLVKEAIVLMSQQQNNNAKTGKNLASSTSISKEQNIVDYVLVVHQSYLLGLFTAVDVIRLIASGKDLSKMNMKEVMVSYPMTMKESDLDDIPKVLSVFNHHQINHLPIVDDQEKLIGIITKSALLQELDLVELYNYLGDLEERQGRIHKVGKYQDRYLHEQKIGLNSDKFVDILVRKKIHEEITISENLNKNIEKFQSIEPEIREQNQKLLVAYKNAEFKRQRYHSLFESTPYAYLITNQYGIIEEVNQAALNLLAVDQESLVNQSIRKFISSTDYQSIIYNYGTSQIIQEKEIEIQSMQENRFPANVRVTPIYNGESQHCGWSWLISDISERQQIKREVTQVTEELEQRVKDRTAELLLTNQVLQKEIKEHQQTEAQLRKSEEIFRKFGEQIQAHIWICTKDCSEIIYVNPAYEKIWGRSCQSLRDNPISWIDAIHPEDREQTIGTIEKYHQQDQGASLEYRIIHTDQSIRWLWARCFPIRNEQGEIQYFGGIAEDITERKLTEQSLRDSEARLNVALETANMGIWEKRVETRHTCIWSDTIGQLYGIGKGALCPSPEEFFQIIYPEDHHIIIGAINDSIEKGKEFTIEYRVIWKDGSIHWLSSTGKLFYNSAGEPDHIIGTTTDISDRKHKEQTLSEQAALLDIATDAIFVRDFHTEILYWNQGAEKIYGWSKDEAIGSNLQNLFYSKISPKQEAIALKNIVKSGKWNGELRKQTKSGKEIIVESRWTLMLDNDGNPKSILIVDTDITKKKQLEDQFYRTQRLQSIGTLAGGIAHDLNNILSPILTSAQLIKGKFAQDPERHLQMLNIIENNARRGSALVKQVLSFAKGIKGERTTVQVKHLIMEILNFSRKTFPKSIEFSTQIPEHLATVFGDSTQLYQVLMNLVVNARDAMPNGGKLKIAAENMFIDEAYSQMHIEANTGHYIVISVSDTGVGIPPEILDQIFERFFTTKEIDSGSGFGLSTVEEIVTNHNGFLTVDSEVGNGSTFKVFLPAVQSPELPTLEEFDIAPSNGELILIVDDEPQIVDVTKIILENNNYRVLTASNGVEAIAVYQQHQREISLVLMDMMMPDMDGVTAISNIQKMNPNVQVIVCSGLGTIDSLPKSAETKVQGVLFKPYTANELLINLNQVIRNS